MLTERQLLDLKMPQGANGLAQLESFKYTYEFVKTAIPEMDLPREKTMFNHLYDEFEKHAAMKKWTDKSFHSSSSRRRTCKWLWSKVQLEIDHLRNQINRQDFAKAITRGGYAPPPKEQPPKTSAASGTVYDDGEGGDGKKKKKKKTKKVKKTRKEEDPPEANACSAFVHAETNQALRGRVKHVLAVLGVRR